MRLTRWRDRAALLAEQVPIVTRGRQGRFLLAILLCWSTARTYLQWPQAAVADRLSAFVAPLRPDILANFVPVPAVSPPFAPGAVIAHDQPPIRYRRIDWSTGIEAARWLLLRLGGGETVSTARALRRATFAYTPPPEDLAEAPAMPAPAPLFPPTRPRQGSAIEAEAYLYWRPGDGSSLSDRGELGGSQFAARIAAPIGHGLGVAGRLYAPIAHRGAEAALGLDWHPLPRAPIRISVERRQRLDALGRSAWSAYAAGGFWRGGGPGKPEVDGYAQAGIVGMQRRDAFLDGALRFGYRLPTPSLAIIVGGGLWGAAQPQVSRLDIGPRIAAVVPIDGHSLTFALDGRIRMAGRAAPGSGAALTIAAGF